MRVASSRYHNFVPVTVKPSASYAAGGDTGDWGAQFGLIGNGKASPDEPLEVYLFPSAGYIPEWDSVNKKVKVYRQSAATGALTEATGDLSAVTFRGFAIFA